MKTIQLRLFNLEKPNYLDIVNIKGVKFCLKNSMYKNIFIGISKNLEEIQVEKNKFDGTYSLLIKMKY